MSANRYCFRNPGQTAPQLGLAQSFWALTARDISMARSLEGACAQGFGYVEVGLREERITTTKELLSRFPVRLIAQGWAITWEEALVFIERAAELNAIAINMHLGHAYMQPDEGYGLICRVRELALARGLAMLLETHRGRLTQDLATFSRLLRRMPDLPITLDLSHYLVAGETLGGSEPHFLEHVAPMLNQTALIHGRISNGQSVQVRFEDEFAFTPVLRLLWRRAMSEWLAQAPLDAVLVFEPELGPPPYAWRLSTGEETFDRTQETYTLAAVARECWAEALESSR